MHASHHIQSYCHVRNGSVLLNGKTIFESAASDWKTFSKTAYRQLDMDHSKFFKMDTLSKLAMIASEPLLRSEPEKNIALVLSNRASSLDTDRKHQKSIEDPELFYPSPAVFVYTLPNICLGEISIKHRLFSENSFFVFDTFNADILYDYATGLLNGNSAEKVLCGWVDNDNEKYGAFLYVVAKNGIFTHSKKRINQLYRTP